MNDELKKENPSSESNEQEQHKEVPANQLEFLKEMEDKMAHSRDNEKFYGLKHYKRHRF